MKYDQYIGIFLGLGFLVLGVVVYLQSSQQSHWPTVQGKIYSNTEETRTVGKSRRLETVYRTAFEYTVNGAEFRGSEDLAEKGKEGESATVHYDPSNPADATLTPGGTASGAIILALAGVALAAVSAIPKRGQRKRMDRQAVGQER